MGNVQHLSFALVFMVNIFFASALVQRNQHQGKDKLWQVTTSKGQRQHIVQSQHGFAQFQDDGITVYSASQVIEAILEDSPACAASVGEVVVW